MKTTNGGITWDILDAESYLHNIYFFDSLTGLAVGTIMLKSVNGGSNWTKLILPPNIERILNIDITNSNTLFIVGYGRNRGYIYKSNDFGEKWSLSYESEFRLNNIFMIDELNGWASGHSRNILETTNGGNSWNVYSFSGWEFVKSIYFASINNGWVLRDAGEILKTTDAGVTWESYSVSFPLANDLFFINDRLGWLVGSNGTILKTVKDGTTVEIYSEKSLSKNYYLKQNYPNPFNSITKIQYSVPEPSLIRMKIYDILGREVGTLIDEIKIPGIHTVEFNAASLSSGVYFYRLEAKNLCRQKNSCCSNKILQVEVSVSFLYEMKIRKQLYLNPQ